LLAMAVGQSTHLPPERTPSPASRLLQLMCVMVELLFYGRKKTRQRRVFPKTIVDSLSVANPC
ncbi:MULTISPECIES: hypothetical protein, partial [unclassified Pseudomonas]|uniref:hypothetical protein n=2 Tax=unclassified Pseudomonas TaxID=196821 RepID=UPI001CBE49FA